MLCFLMVVVLLVYMRIKIYEANDIKYHLDGANSRGFDWSNHLNL